MAHINIVAGGTRAREGMLSIDAFADFGYQIVNQEHIFTTENDLLKNFIGTKRALFVVSPTVYYLYGAEIGAYLNEKLAHGQYRIVISPSTEKNKNMDALMMICNEAKDFRLDRDGLFIAVGGGIILDLVGFAASIYRRGTKYIKIPTTLVGQVDVAVGVKTGLNFENSKNILGTYYPAYATLNDKCFLKTLPLRELRCGLAEVIKMGLVTDSSIFERLERIYAKSAAVNPSDIDYGIYTDAMVRMIEELQPNLLEVELERIVDFGHTFSMRFETETNHRLEHGEAVSIDMALSCCIAQLKGQMDIDDCVRAVTLLKQVGLPIFDECCTLASLKGSIDDVCLHRNAVNLVLPTQLGKGNFIKNPEELDDKLLSNALDMLEKFSAESIGLGKLAYQHENV